MLCVFGIDVSKSTIKLSTIKENRLHRALQLVFLKIENILSNFKNDLYYFLVKNFCQPKNALTYSNNILLTELIKKELRSKFRYKELLNG